ncbi:MAG: phycobilisome linker polypeptide [Elainellaceae cyanobacterium]
MSMNGQAALTNPSDSSASNRVFIYEVKGIQPSKLNKYQVRRSGNLLIRVPYDRMNEEMQRLTRMGASIVNIHTSMPSEEASEASTGGDD